mgnify:CR=1 FL=1
MVLMTASIARPDLLIHALAYAVDYVFRAVVTESLPRFIPVPGRKKYERAIAQIDEHIQGGARNHAARVGLETPRRAGGRAAGRARYDAGGSGAGHRLSPVSFYRILVRLAAQVVLGIAVFLWGAIALSPASQRAAKARHRVVTPTSRGRTGTVPPRHGCATSRDGHGSGARLPSPRCFGNGDALP